MTALTVRQKEVFDFIVSFIDGNACSPTYSEIASNFGFTNNAALEHVKAIEKKKVITIAKPTNGRAKMSRSIRLVQEQ